MSLFQEETATLISAPSFREKAALAIFLHLFPAGIPEFGDSSDGALHAKRIAGACGLAVAAADRLIKHLNETEQ